MICISHISRVELCLLFPVWNLEQLQFLSNFYTPIYKHVFMNYINGQYLPPLTSMIMFLHLCSFHSKRVVIVNVEGGGTSPYHLSIICMWMIRVLKFHVNLSFFHFIVWIVVITNRACLAYFHVCKPPSTDVRLMIVMFDMGNYEGRVN